MNADELSNKARALIRPGSELTERHLEFLKRMIAIDSRSFGVGEFDGDRTTLPDMKEILELAETYLSNIGFSKITINHSPDGEKLLNPILMAELHTGNERPTLLFYAHLDKQPYMDNEQFLQWGGTPPTQARWNDDRTRLYGRGAADDLAGVTAIGMTAEALLLALGHDQENPSPEVLENMPCNIKVIYETEEESGSHTLIEQIQQNEDFFKNVDCVLITDVINPATGFPGLTTSLRGIIQMRVELMNESEFQGMDTQTALYKLTSTLIDDHHALAVRTIADADIPVTVEDARSYELVPTTVTALRNGSGVLPGVLPTVPHNKSEMIQAQLRRSFANARPGNRVSGSIIFGCAGARLSFDRTLKIPKNKIKLALEKFFIEHNQFQLEFKITTACDNYENWVAYDIILKASSKDPHSGVHGGPFPVAELQLAKMIDRLIANDGTLNLEDDELKEIRPKVEALYVQPDLTAKTFQENLVSEIIEIRLAPGNNEENAKKNLREHLTQHLPEGFRMNLKEDKGASPWSADTTHKAFPSILSSLEIGYGKKPCLYGCGGSIPFVPKLSGALGGVPSLCLGAYDPESKMHEPGESLSMLDWLGCAKSMIHFAANSKKSLLVI